MLDGKLRGRLVKAGLAEPPKVSTLGAGLRPVHGGVGPFGNRPRPVDRRKLEGGADRCHVAQDESVQGWRQASLPDLPPFLREVFEAADGAFWIFPSIRMGDKNLRRSFEE